MTLTAFSLFFAELYVEACKVTDAVLHRYVRMYCALCMR